MLATVKLGHTRIFINIKKNAWYKKCYKIPNSYGQMATFGHSTGQPEKYICKNLTPWKLRRVVVSIDNMLLSTELIEYDIQNRIQKTQL